MNFLKETYSESTFNSAPMVGVQTEQARELIERNSQDGYIVISVGRVSKTAEADNGRIKQLAQRIEQEGFVYTPLFEPSQEHEDIQDYKTSFIIYAHDKERKARTMGELEKLGESLRLEFGTERLATAGEDLLGDSLKGAFINPRPQCYSEAHLRHLKGEIFLDYLK
ncbi:MAG: hypothetical protein MJY67_01735 [Bacteroidales bacterium]|nr:hypothetical protein [Bacteroidales bacterium]